VRGSPLAWLCVLGMLLSPCALSFACAESQEPGELDVQVRVERIGLDANDLPVMLLREHDGGRWLPIWIGPAEAQSIAAEIEDRESPRPNAHDLARRVIEGLHGELERVVVTDLRSGTYYATITLRSSGRRVEIDSRPSDAVAIALRTGAPIFVRARLFAEASDDSDAARDDSTSI
jgi:uncharacterized protein